MRIPGNIELAILCTLCGNITTKVAHNISLVNSTPAIYQPRTRNFDGSTKIRQMETLNSSNEMMNDTDRLHLRQIRNFKKIPEPDWWLDF